MGPSQRIHIAWAGQSPDSSAACGRLAGGDYRVVYVIDDDIVTVTVVRLGHRRNAYR